jgi:hypothetical protein
MRLLLKRNLNNWYYKLKARQVAWLLNISFTLLFLFLQNKSLITDQRQLGIEGWNNLFLG